MMNCINSARKKYKNTNNFWIIKMNILYVNSDSSHYDKV